MFVLVDSIIRTDAQYAVPCGTLLKPLVHVPNFRRLVSSDPARVTTGSTHDLLDMVSQFLTSYYMSLSVQECESYPLFCLERQAFSGASGHFLIWQCTSVTRHFVRLVIPLSQGTSRVMHAGHRKASEHQCPVWKSFAVRLIRCRASKFIMRTPCPFLVLMAY